MSKHTKLRSILLKKFPDAVFVERMDSVGNFWISSFDLVKIIETKEIPHTFISNYMRNGVKYYSADNLLYFFRLSSNPHHTLDYLIPLGLEFVERPLLDVVRLFDKYGIRGKYNYNMNECSNCLNFVVSYYYHCPIPLLVDVYSQDQDPMRENLYKMFELQRCRCIEIDTRDWANLKDTILFNIESHLVKLNALSFMEKVIKGAEEIQDVVDELGEDVVGACCSGDEFPFSLLQCLKKFRITETNPKYKEIIALFETEETNIEMEQNQLETIDEECDNIDVDTISDIAVGGDSDHEEQSDVDESDCAITTQYNGNTMYVAGRDYLFQDGDYYLNHPTLIKIAIRSGVRKAEQYVDMSWRLIQYINTYGRQAYSSLLKTMDMTVDERKQMFTITNNTLEQNMLSKLRKAQERIEELESHIDVNKTRKQVEKYIKTQAIECQKDQVATVTNVTVTASKEKFVVNEKKPTKVKPSSVVKKTKDPIKNDELELFLGL
jgi:hypothetical protein